MFDYFNVNLRKNERFCNFYPVYSYSGIKSIERALSMYINKWCQSGLPEYFLMKVNSCEHYEKSDFARGRSILHNLPSYIIIKKGRRAKISI